MRWTVAVFGALWLAACATRDGVSGGAPSAPAGTAAPSPNDASLEPDTSMPAAADDAAMAPAIPLAIPCRGRPLQRCTLGTPDCYEIIPGYGVLYQPTHEHGTATSCVQPPDPYPPVTHACCSDEDCGDGAVCMSDIADSQTNFPPNRCCTPGCLSQADCGPGEYCQPVIGYTLCSRCQRTECLADADCEPGYVCAPAWQDEEPGNHQLGFGGVQCIPDPRACTR